MSEARAGGGPRPCWGAPVCDGCSAPAANFRAAGWDWCLRKTDSGSGAAGRILTWRAGSQQRLMGGSGGCLAGRPLAISAASTNRRPLPARAAGVDVLHTAMHNPVSLPP